MSNSTNPIYSPDERVAKQYKEAARWAGYFTQRGYAVELHGTGEAYPFHFEWRVFGRVNSKWIASIDIDGCGASWHGDDELWLDVVGPHEGVTA